MPSLRDIKRKITSVKKTQQITKAMKMVAAAKLRRAQDRVVAARPYARKMLAVIANLAAGVERAQHPLLAKREPKKVKLLVLTSDRGLCGAYNTNIVRKAVETVRQLQAEGKEVKVNVVGRKGRDFFRKRSGYTLGKVWSELGTIDYEKAADVGKNIVERFAAGETDEVYLLYNEFKSVMQQKVTLEKLLPVEPPDEADPFMAAVDYLYEPSAEAILGSILPKHIEVQVYRSMLESQASEMGSRMTAMDSATRNAKDMIGRLTLKFNKQRQAAITKEISEIVGGAEAQK
ncbi:MAG: F0F1 ATP synthase subunit gamma [Nitrospirae bacterium GWC2_57_13]|jgi:F-type H+-transporting ATPase subunit gamma|nr:MAG: F0F1 ATP synthase subunit gamma [Nitrospirae bacterium GWC2_57_13]